MKLETPRNRPQGDAAAAMLRALRLACTSVEMEDGRRDAIVGHLEEAAAAVAEKALGTDADSRLIEGLENLILDLRIQGASHAPAPPRARPSGS